jgi:transposase
MNVEVIIFSPVLSHATSKCCVKCFEWNMGKLQQSRLFTCEIHNKFHLHYVIINSEVH